MEEKGSTDKEYIIPFIHRKSLLLSISFRATNLEMSEYKMEVSPINKSILKEPLITGLCETTMVNNISILILYFFS
jgi:hypothetical protein